MKLDGSSHDSKCFGDACTDKNLHCSCNVSLGGFCKLHMVEVIMNRIRQMGAENRGLENDKNRCICMNSVKSENYLECCLVAWRCIWNMAWWWWRKETTTKNHEHLNLAKDISFCSRYHQDNSMETQLLGEDLFVSWVVKHSGGCLVASFHQGDARKEGAFGFLFRTIVLPTALTTWKAHDSKQMVVDPHSLSRKLFGIQSKGTFLLMRKPFFLKKRTHV